MRADPEARVVLRDHHLGVLRRERLREQQLDRRLHLLLIVDQLVETLRRAPAGLREVLVFDVGPEDTDAFEDLFVSLGEEGEGLGIELHGVSWYFSRIAVVA